MLSVTFVQIAAGARGEFSAKWLLFFSWVAFIATVLAGVVRYNWTGRARAARLYAEQGRAEILFRVRGLTFGPELLQQVNQITREVLAEALKESDEAIDIHDNLTLFMLLSFAVGLIGLAIFAGVNLP